MKKTYEKPSLYAETFQMTEHIASGCVLDKKDDGSWNAAPQFNLENECAMWMSGDPDFAFFRDGWGGCKYNTGTMDMGCYNSFVTPDTAFSS